MCIIPLLNTIPYTKFKFCNVMFDIVTVIRLTASLGQISDFTHLQYKPRQKAKEQVL